MVIIRASKLSLTHSIAHGNETEWTFVSHRRGRMRCSECMFLFLLPLLVSSVVWCTTKDLSDEPVSLKLRSHLIDVHAVRHTALAHISHTIWTTTMIIVMMTMMMMMTKKKHKRKAHKVDEVFMCVYVCVCNSGCIQWMHMKTGLCNQQLYCAAFCLHFASIRFAFHRSIISLSLINRSTAACDAFASYIARNTFLIVLNKFASASLSLSFASFIAIWTTFIPWFLNASEQKKHEEKKTVCEATETAIVFQYTFFSLSWWKSLTLSVSCIRRC